MKLPEPLNSSGETQQTPPPPPGEAVDSESRRRRGELSAADCSLARSLNVCTAYMTILCTFLKLQLRSELEYNPWQGMGTQVRTPLLRSYSNPRPEFGEDK